MLKLIWCLIHCGFSQVNFIYLDSLHGILKHSKDYYCYRNGLKYKIYMPLLYTRTLESLEYVEMYIEVKYNTDNA